MMSIPSGSIATMKPEQFEDRGDVKLPVCWVHTPSSMGKLPQSSALTPVSRCEDQLPQPTTDNLFIALLGPKAPDVIRTAIQRAANQGARVYVIASHADLKDASTLLGRVEAKVLIRRVSSIPCSAILTVRGDDAGLFLGPHLGSPKWWMPLSKVQGQSLFQYVLHLFWHQASDEGWAETSSIKFQPARERPFDIPSLPQSAALRSQSKAISSKRGTWYSPSGAPPMGQVSKKILVLPGGADQAKLAQCVEKGAQVAWSNIGLPAFTLEKSTGVLHVGNALRVKLEANQVGAFESIVARMIQSPEWSFHTDLPLAEITGDVLLPGETNTQPPIDDHVAPCGSVRAKTLRLVPSTQPTKRPEIPVLARKVTWTWTVEPPRAPKGYKVAPLVTAWQRLDQSVKKRLEDLQKQLADVDDHTSVLRRAFDTLASALLGFGRKQTALSQRIGILAAHAPSELGPEGALDLLDSIAELEVQAKGLTDQINEAERKAKEDKERAEQRATFDTSQGKARQDYTRYKKDLSEWNQTHVDAESALGELELATAKVDGLTKAEKKDRRVKQKKLRDKVKQAEKRIRSLEQHIAAAQDVIDAEFVFKPRRVMGHVSHTGKARFVPATKTKSKILPPEEALPVVGKLVIHKKKLFLMITQWQALDEGESEAKRLGAQLVAPPS